MRQSFTTFTFSTPGAGFTEITSEISRWIAGSGIETGVLTLHCLHTSASLLITENASPAVLHDLARWLGRAAPESDHYEHDEEGPDDMPAHIKSVLAGVNLSIPVRQGRMALGTWQGIFLAEHRDRPHRRDVTVHLLGE